MQVLSALSVSSAQKSTISYLIFLTICLIKLQALPCHAIQPPHGEVTSAASTVKLPTQKQTLSIVV